MRFLYRDASKDGGAARPMRMVGFDIFAPLPEASGDVEVWEENQDAVRFFASYCATQWRYVSGMGGVAATGLDHAAVLSDLRTLRLGRERFDAVYADVRFMEMAALEEMAKARNVK